MREINIPRFMISRDMLSPEKMDSLLYKVLFFQIPDFTEFDQNRILIINGNV